MRSHSQGSLSWKELSLVPHTIILMIRESWRLSNSYLELKFFNSVTKLWKFWPSCCLCVKKLWHKMVVFFLGLQYSENLWSKGADFISSPSSRVKVSYISLPFWPIHVSKMDIFLITLGILFCCSQIKINVFESKFSSMRYIVIKRESLRRF